MKNCVYQKTKVLSNWRFFWGPCCEIWFEWFDWWPLLNENWKLKTEKLRLSKNQSFVELAVFLRAMLWNWFTWFDWWPLLNENWKLKTEKLRLSKNQSFVELAVFLRAMLWNFIWVMALIKWKMKNEKWKIAFIKKPKFCRIGGFFEGHVVKFYLSDGPWLKKLK